MKRKKKGALERYRGIRLDRSDVKKQAGRQKGEDKTHKKQPEPEPTEGLQVAL